MEKALRNRLTFGPMMLGGLFSLLILDHAIEGWSKHWRWYVDFTGEASGLQGVGLLVLLLLILPLATSELAVLFTAERVRPYRLLA
ncbi:MAG TPA: hypothetical protein VH370_21465, partial [Humisphaera sp.]|nr:hypothetical protein [Humisphaera sp.]